MIIMQKISAIITTYNETDNIGGVIDCLDWVDEILVVDSFSEDDTAEKARALGAKVIQRKYKGPADQKNFAIETVENDWIILLDADERLVPELINEIQLLLAKDDIEKDAYWIGRRNFFLEKEIKYSGWQGDAVVRFFNKKCRYNDLQVHEEIETANTNVGRLQHKILHYTYKNIAHYIQKMDRYAQWSAEDHLRKGKKATWAKFFYKPYFRFVKHYFIQMGWRDGIRGVIVSGIMAWGVFMRYVYMWEKQQK